MDRVQLRHVAIVGAGFSGTLLAINLLRHDHLRVTLIERGGRFGAGVAYATDNPAHLLNVRAGNMSAFPEQPDHFVNWRARNGHADPQGFARRSDYGAYLGSLLADAKASAPGRLALCNDTAADVSISQRDVRLQFDSGARMRANAVVLAVGNLPPHDPSGLRGAELDDDRYVSDPWKADICADLSDEDTVLLLGTGLTMVDVVLMLNARGFRGRIVALSRRGLVPHAHDPAAGMPVVEAAPVERGADLVRFVRGRAREVGWRTAVDALRPHIQEIWRTTSEARRQSLLRHLRPWWDIHRHRLAPSVAAAVTALRWSGQLRIVAGKLAGVEPRGNDLTARWQLRGTGTVERLQVRRIVNCTGPQGDLLPTQQPLLRLLLASGHIRPDRHRLGLDVDAGARAKAADGQPHDRLFAIGPLTRGAFWEIVAVPDIRVQARDLAASLAGTLDR